MSNMISQGKIAPNTDKKYPYSLKNVSLEILIKYY